MSVAPTTMLPPEPNSLTAGEAPLPNTKIAIEDDFDVTDFDDVDFSMADEGHPDEVVVDETVASNHFTNDNVSNTSKAANLQRIISPSKQPSVQAHSRPVPRLAQQMPNLPPQIQPTTTGEKVPQLDRTSASTGRPPTTTSHHPIKSMSAPQGVKTEPSGMNQTAKADPGDSTFSSLSAGTLKPPLVPALGSANTSLAPSDTSNGPPLFFSARAASMLQTPNPSGPPPIAVFNPHAESPSIRKTAGVDHTKSMKLWKETDPAKETSQIVNLTAKSNQSGMEGTRRIGMPPNTASPIANRSSYKPPLKRPHDGGNFQGYVLSPVVMPVADDLCQTSSASAK